jgi:HlyD family secretion protein
MSTHTKTTKPRPRGSLLRWVKRGAVVAVLAAIVATLVWAMLPKPAPVEVVSVRRGALRVTVDEDGRARVIDRHVVAAPLAGSLARIELHPGDSVAEGATVARIAPLPSPLLDARTRAEIDGRVSIAQARVKQAASAIERVQVAHDYAKAEHARIKALVDQRALPRVELDRRQFDLDAATRELESMRFAAAIARDELATARALAARLGKPAAAGEEVAVLAPIAGRVLRVYTASEGVVAPGTPLLELGDAGRLELAVDVLTADAVQVRPGAEVEVRGWGGDPLRGVVRLVEPSATTRISALGVEEQRVAVIVDLVDPPEAWQGLGDGWRVEARITTATVDDAVLVPLGALFRDGERWAVYVVDGGRAKLRHVELGARGGNDAEVVSGLAAGDRVIYHPSERITDGARVAGD